MTTLKESIDALLAQGEVLNAAKAEYQRLREEVIALHSPVRVGDVVTVNRYAHEGKQIRVTRVVLVENVWGKKWRASATGKVLKKDGSEGLNTAEYTVDLDYRASK